MSDQNLGEWGFRVPHFRDRPTKADELIQQIGTGAVWRALPPDKQQDFTTQHPHVWKEFTAAANDHRSKKKELKKVGSSTRDILGQTESDQNAFIKEVVAHRIAEVKQEKAVARKLTYDRKNDFAVLLGTYIEAQGLTETVINETNRYMTTARIAALGSSTSASVPGSPATSPPPSRAASPVLTARSMSPG